MSDEPRPTSGACPAESHGPPVLPVAGLGARLRRVGLLAVVAALPVWLLWWIDPRQARVPFCGFHTMTGLHCPGCGATRATHELLHGQVAAALSDNALWVVLAPLVLYWAVSQGLHYVCGRRLPWDLLRSRWFFGLVVVAAVAFGVVRNLPWEPFCRLAPKETAMANDE